MMNAGNALRLFLALLLAACGSSALSPADAAPPVLACPLSAQVNFRWIGRGAVESYRLVPPAAYQRERADSPLCTRAVPDCGGDAATIDLGDLGAALGQSDVTSSWPGSGQKVFTFDSPNVEEQTFEVEAAGRGTIVVSPHCDASGCVSPPTALVDLSHILRRLITQLACP
jgi:hypothetical protein